MAGATQLSLRGQTIVYNGIQFGGRDSAVKMMPPEYKLTSRAVYDSAGRTIIYREFTLTISGTLFHDDQDKQERQMERINRALMTEGRVLQLGGMGLGFKNYLPDVAWGPKPVAFDWQPVGGTQASNFLFTIQFRGARCPPTDISSSRPDNGILEFNFDTTWEYDESGMATRVIRGHMIFAQVNRFDLEPNGYNVPVRFVADELRRLITVHLPKGFRRLQWNFHENEAKDRLDFTFVDKQFDAEPFPPGIVEAAGSFTASASQAGFHEGTARLEMTLKHAPDQPKALLLATFLTMAAAAERQLLEAAKKGRKTKSAVLPLSISVSPKLWSREASFSIEWTITGCVQDILFAEGIWKPAPNAGWDAWKASMEHILGNDGGHRGWSQIGSVRGEGAIINICQTQDQFDIGQGNADQNPRHQNLQFKFQCPDLPESQSWIGYRVNLIVLREDNQTLHRKAVQYEQGQQPSTYQQPVTFMGKTSTWTFATPDYQQSAADQHTIELNGQPRIRVALQFNGLRIKHMPTPPVLESIDGKKVRFIEDRTEPAQVVGHILHCPIYHARMVRIYEVVGGNVAKAKSLGNPSICDAPEISTAQ